MSHLIRTGKKNRSESCTSGRSIEPRCRRRRFAPDPVFGFVLGAIRRQRSRLVFAPRRLRRHRMGPRTNPNTGSGTNLCPRRLGSMERPGAQLSARFFLPVPQQRPLHSAVPSSLPLADPHFHRAQRSAKVDFAVGPSVSHGLMGLQGQPTSFKGARLRDICPSRATAWPRRPTVMTRVTNTRNAS